MSWDRAYDDPEDTKMLICQLVMSCMYICLFIEKQNFSQKVFSSNKNFDNFFTYHISILRRLIGRYWLGQFTRPEEQWVGIVKVVGDSLDQAFVHRRCHHAVLWGGRVRISTGRWRYSTGLGNGIGPRSGGCGYRCSGVGYRGGYKGMVGRRRRWGIAAVHIHRCCCDWWCSCRNAEEVTILMKITRNNSPY